MEVEEILRYATIRSISTLEVSAANTGVGLWTVNINKGVSLAVLKIYDGTSTSGTLIAELDASTKSSHLYGVACTKGIFLDLSGAAADCTIGYG